MRFFAILNRFDALFELLQLCIKSFFSLVVLPYICSHQLYYLYISKVHFASSSEVSKFREENIPKVDLFTDS